jgi:hypothetical protein
VAWSCGCGARHSSLTDCHAPVEEREMCRECEEVEVSGPGESCAECLLASGFCPVGHTLDEDERCRACEAEEAADWAMDCEAEGRI